MRGGGLFGRAGAPRAALTSAAWSLGLLGWAVSGDAGSLETPAPYTCVAPVLIEGALRCLEDAPSPTWPAGGAAPYGGGNLCAAPLIPGDSVGCGSGGIVRSRMTPDELAALNVPLDLNAASGEDLTSLRGIGPVLADRIVAGRPFENAAQTRSVRGIGPGKIRAVRARTCVACPPPRWTRWRVAGP